MVKNISEKGQNNPETKHHRDREEKFPEQGQNISQIETKYLPNGDKRFKDKVSTRHIQNNPEKKYPREKEKNPGQKSNIPPTGTENPPDRDKQPRDMEKLSPKQRQNILETKKNPKQGQNIHETGTK